MKEPEQIIRDILRENMKRVEDESFTENVIRQYLSKRRIKASGHFFNFASLIIGVSLVLISLGLVFIFRTETIVIENDILNERHGMILFSIALLFIIYKFLEEYIVISKFSR